MRYLFGFLCVCALGVVPLVGCSESTGEGGSGGSASLCGAIAEGLVACYPFNGNADDGSGSGHDGTVHGATLTADRFAKTESAYDFDGENSHISIAIDDELQTQTTTISAWVNVTELGEDWIDAVCFGTHGHVLALEETGLPLGGMQGSETCEFVGTTVVAPGEWYMLTMTRDADSMIRIYTNGVLEAEQACTKMLSEDNSELQIGSCEGWEEFFNGAIDDVVIYNRPLSSDEIMTLYCEDGWCG